MNEIMKENKIINAPSSFLPLCNSLEVYKGILKQIKAGRHICTAKQRE